ncbi:MAG: class I SAM-dependent methyltransferase [Candidatus Marinimicrobia bacterium]|nr:class I SAM-dependent methyltransferase [Candidatus Neomarinimicrobiota bacterium]
MPEFRYCEACGNRDVTSLKQIYEIDGYDVLKCEVCGFVYVDNPALTEVSSKIFYDLATVETHDRYKDTLMAVAESHWEDIQKLDIEGGSSILDFGCGNGYFLSIAQNHGMKTLGLEINEAAAEYGKEKLGVEIIAELPPYPSLEGKKFDVITMWGGN